MNREHVMRSKFNKYTRVGYTHALADDQTVPVIVIHWYEYLRSRTYPFSTHLRLYAAAKEALVQRATDQI